MMIWSLSVHHSQLTPSEPFIYQYGIATPLLSAFMWRNLQMQSFQIPSCKEQPPNLPTYGVWKYVDLRTNAKNAYL